MKKFFKWLAYGIAALIVLLTIVAGITQTSFFRERLRLFALDQLDSLLIAEVRIGEINGNLVSGFSIDSVSIKVQDDYFVSMERLDIRYDLFAIPSKKINVSSLTLVRPQIAFLRGRDSVWNFVRMVRPTPDDSASTPFDWPISVGRLEIQHGAFRLVDSASLHEPDHDATSSLFVEYHDFAVRDLNMIVKPALVTPKEKRAAITLLNFVSDQPNIRLRKFSGDFLLTQKEAAVKKLQIVTDHSNVSLDASMKNIDLLGGFDLADLKSKPVNVSLTTKTLDLNELKRFIHQIDFLDGNVNTELEAQGEFGRLQVKHLNMETRQSKLQFAGSVLNLHTPGKLALDVKCRESVIQYNDVLASLPSFDLPDFSAIGATRIDFDFSGEPLDFKTNLTLRSDAGTIRTQGASLAIGGPASLQYNGEFLVEGLNPAPLLHDEKLAGKLNGILAINGAGTTLDDLNATIDARFDSSEFVGSTVGPSRIAFTSVEKKLQGVVNLNVSSMRTQLNAELDRRNPIPSFKIDGNLASLNLADFVEDKTQKSNLTLALRVEGTGLEWAKLNGSGVLDFSSSRYKEFQIDSGLVAVAIDQRDPLNSSIRLQSRMADFDIKGQFDLDYIVGLIRYEVENLSLAVGGRFRSLDTTLATTLDVRELQAFGQRLKSENKTLNTEYTLTLKNLQPLSIFAGNRAFDGIGTIEGSLVGNYDSLSGSARFQLKEFFYGNVDSGMLIQDGVLSLKFSDLFPTNPLSDLRLRVRVDAGKMHVNRTKLDTLTFGIFYDQEYAGFTVQADYDKDYHLKTNGQVSVEENSVIFALTKMQTAYRDFAWNVDDGATVVVNQAGLGVRNFLLRRGNQVIRLEGFVREGDEFEARLVGSSLDLAGLKYVLGEEEPGTRGFEGIANVEARARGTLDNPLYETTLRARDVFYRGFPFGEIRGTIGYADQLLTSDIVIDNRRDTTVGAPDLTVHGTLPLNLSLKGESESRSDTPMDFKVYSDGLQMSLLDPILPTFNDLTGTLKANFNIGGTPKNPSFIGAMSIEGCSFLFVPNNMYYKLDGTFKPSGERIQIVNATVRNIDADNKPGRIGVLNIVGDFAFKELVPSDFNLSANGQLLVVNRNTLTSDLSVYGELPVEVRQGDLHFTGDLGKLLLKGAPLVRNSILAFPPTSTSAKEDTFFIPFRIVDDTVKVAEEGTESVASRYFTSAANNGRRFATLSGEEIRTPSFIEGLRYDLNVEFAGTNNEVRMIFNAATNEELVAYVAGKVAITEDGKYWVGTVTIPRASYNFYGKRFDAEGTISYTGNFLDPELNITATYEGTRRYDDNSKEENVVVTYKITGTRFAPQPEISMRIDDVDYAAYKATPTSNDVESDALTFLITNNFPLSRGERNDIAAQVGPTVGAGLVGGATSLLTSAFAEFLRTKTGFINSFEFRYDRGGSFGESADVRLGGTAFKGYWRYGGKILEDPFSNANFSILYSFGDIFDKPSLRNFMFELERKVDTSLLVGSIEATRREINSARFFYRFSF